MSANTDGCSFINNSADLGGAICAGREVVIRNSIFIRNSAEYGGAIYMSGGARRLIAENCLFDANAAEKLGGSICSDRLYYPGFEDYNTEMSISDSNFTNSRAGEKGSAIYCSVCDLTLSSVNINSSGGCDEICQDLGEFKSANSTYNSITRITEHKATFSVDKLKYYEYGWGADFSVLLHDDTAGRDFNFAKVKIKVWTGKKYKEYVMTLNYHHVAAAILEIDKRFSVGKHKVEVTPISKYINAGKLTTYFIVKKAKTIVKAPVVKAKYKKSKKFKVTVKLDRYNPLSKVKIKIKVYTGKKSKTYKVKTNRKGVASINTKKLKRGTHKVTISSLNKNYSISKKSKIIIR